MSNTSPDSLALPLVQYNASLVAPAWGPYPSVLELEGPQLRVRDVELREELGDPWQLSVHVMSNSAQFDPARLVGADFSLHMLREDAANPAENDGRFFHGVVHRSSYIGSFADAYHAQLWVGPALELLANTRRARIFQDLNVVEIMQEVAGELLAARGRELDVSRLAREYGARDYCVQYRETDLAFVQRVLAEEGISIGFEADESVERTVLYDDRDRFESVLRTVEGLDGDPPPQHVLVRGDRGELSPDETISAFAWRRTVHPVHAGVEQWDWKQAAPTNLQASVVPEGGEAPWHHGEQYQHGDRRLQEADGGDGQHTDNSLDHAERLQHRVSLEASAFDGRGNVMSMMPGATFELDGHPDAELNGLYYCLRVTHHADNADAELGGGGGSNYDNDFVCAPVQSAYAPAQRSQPRIFGLQTATVVGPAAEEIHTDAYGRVKVRMHWDREQRAQDDDTSCWLRVAQSWAGAGFGSQFIPRVGMEVLVSFLGGDPDRPVCVGSVYNGQNMPPFSLPDEKTKSGIRTQSSPGGQGHNELRFDDAAGSEEVYLHAQKNLNERVLNAHAMRVGATQNVSVGSSQSVAVGGTRSVSISGHHTMKVGAPPPEDAEAGAGAGPSNHELTVTGNIHQSSDQAILVEAPVEIKLVCGGTTSVTLTPHGIIMQAGGGAKVDLTAAISLLAAGGAMGMTVSDGGFMNMKSSAGGEMQLDGELHATTSGGSRLDMTGDIGIAAGTGATMLLNGDIRAEGGAIRNKSNGANLDLTSAIEGRAQNVAFAAGGTQLQLSGPEIKMVSNAANITGFAMVSIGAPTVKIN